MKLSISNIAWSVEYDVEMYEYISSKGFKGLEIAPTRIFPENPYKDLTQAKKYSDYIKQKYNLEISSMQSILFGKTERLFGTDNERTELLNYSKLAIDFAKAISCHNLVFGSPKNRVIENEDQYPIAIIFFKELGDYALKNNTVLSIEANPPIYNTNFVNTTEQAFQLARDVNSLGIFVNVDLGTVIQNNENIDQIINNIDLINHFHISEPNLVPIEKRSIHQELANKLIQTSYDKYISIEMKNPDNLDIVKSSMEYVKGVFNVS